MHLSMGDMTIDRIVELEHWPFAPRDLFPDLSRPCHDRLDLQIATYLIRTPDATVLVDAGNGNDKERPVLSAHAGFRTDYLDRLAALVPLDAIDIVVCTHLHPDHCGGLTRLVDGAWTPVFPRARHLVAAPELSWLQKLHAAAPPDGVEADLARTYADSVLPVAEASLLELVDAPRTIVPGVTLRPLPGHTEGHLVVEVVSAEGIAVISGDALHHPLQFDDLDLSQAGDADPHQATRSRHDLCATLARTHGLLLPAHFQPGHVAADSTGFSFIPLPSDAAERVR
jgi:glyoxylase-like metal-dependent hydrolase (beta-lactamase superfamily II)